MTGTVQGRGFRYYDLTVAGMVGVLLCANLIGPAKVSTVTLPWFGAVAFGAGNLFFPISYIFGDVLTEVYGYARARRATWAAFAMLLFAVLMVQAVIHLPSSAAEPFNRKLQPALVLVFGDTWRVALASLAGFWLGNFANAYVMAKMKLLTRGRWLWTRTIGSTIVGEGIDSFTFFPIAFLGIWEPRIMLAVVTFNWIMKVVVETVLTPVTYAVVGFLKRRENADTWDTHTDFNPFRLQDDGDVRTFRAGRGAADNAA